MWDLCVTECIAVQSVDSTGMCSICRLINSVLSVVRLLLTAMIKRDALKGRKPFQFTPDTSWMSSIHLDRNGRSFSSPRLILWLGPSQVRTHFSPALCLVPFIFVPCFSLSRFFLFPQTLVLFPPLSLLSHPSCLPRLHIKADDWFQTVKQAVFSPALCEETNIISINIGENLLLW